VEVFPIQCPPPLLPISKKKKLLEGSQISSVCPSGKSNIIAEDEYAALVG
jgi:hypothetical protein